MTTATPAAELAAAHHRPPPDLTDTHYAFEFLAALPGVTPGDVAANFDDGILTIHGSVAPRQAQRQESALREYGVADYHRTFAVDAPVAADKIVATLRDGLLTVTVPKAESTRRRKIEVKVG